MQGSFTDKVALMVGAAREGSRDGITPRRLGTTAEVPVSAERAAQ